jgi:glutathione S-transferase
MTLPILYSYRRCPYAMRARMALKYAGIEVEHREIELRNKPQSMLNVSPKGTVPVLCVGEVTLDQSLDIVRWALDQSDPNGWQVVDEAVANDWIEKNDGPFKKLLDQYKYIERYPDLNQEDVLVQALELMLIPMETALQSSQHLLGENISWVDIAIFPFIRQFAMAEPNKFNDLQLPNLKRWLNYHLESTLFLSVMHKYPSWID